MQFLNPVPVIYCTIMNHTMLRRFSSYVSRKGSWSLTELQQQSGSQGHVITGETIKRLGDLSRLQLDESQVDQLASDVDKIIQFTKLIQVSLVFQQLKYLIIYLYSRLL